MKKNSYGLLRSKRNQLIRGAKQAKIDGLSEKKTDLEMRIKYLTALRATIASPDKQLATQTVFISYSKRRGSLYFENVKEIAENFGFQVVTGFDRQQGENVLKEVIQSINGASVFLSILTPDYQIKSVDDYGEMKTAPSVWLIEEKGMALALGKPFRLLVHETVHQDFWLRTTPGVLHTQFSDENFKDKASEAIEALEIRYDELLLKDLEAPEFDQD